MPSARLRSVSSPSAITDGHVAVLALALVGCGLSGPVDPFRAHYISVEGRVTDESGAGVADAQVGITSVFADAFGVCGPAGGTPHASVLSRGRGSFSHVFEYLTGATSRSCIRTFPLANGSTNGEGSVVAKLAS